MDSNRICTSEFVINNLPTDQREFLMKKKVQDAICKFADVRIQTRGFFIKPRPDGTLLMDNKRPLYLHITGLSKRNLSLAVQKIQSYLNKPRLALSDDEEEFIDTEKITIGIDVFPSIFRMKAKILGEKNENVEYILNEADSVMTLRGKGSGFLDLKTKKESDEPLHVHVRYKNRETKDKARELILNLIETVQQDFASTYGKYYSRPRKPEIIPVIQKNALRRASSHNSLPTKSPNRSRDRSLERKSSERRNFEAHTLDRRNVESRIPETRPLNNRPPEIRPVNNRVPVGRIPETKVAEPNPPPPPINENISSNIEKITIGLESVPLSFGLKSKIYGPNLANVKHIEKVANALLLVEGKGCGPDNKGVESKEPPYILVKYLKPELKETARGLIFNLIETIQQDFIAKFGRYPIDPKKPQTFPIKKLMNDKMSKSPVNTPKINKPAEITPIPPPPPVISKPVSPDGFDNVPPPPSYGMTRSKPLSPTLFSNPEPTPVPRPIPTLAPPIIPPASTFDTAPFGRSSDPVESLPVNVQIPGLSAQSSLVNTAVTAQTQFLVNPASFATPETPQAQIQTIQYNKKRSKSPIVEPFSQSKKFCNSGLVEPKVGGPFSATTANANASVQGGQGGNTSKGKYGHAFTNNRYLVPIQTANEKTTASTMTASTPSPQALTPQKTPEAPKKPIAGILKKPHWQQVRNGNDGLKSDSEDEEERKSIILIDSEEEDLEKAVRISATVTNAGVSRDISVQTDDKLWQWQIKNIKCACGRFSHVLTGVRTVGVQTIGDRRLF